MLNSGYIGKIDGMYVTTVHQTIEHVTLTKKRNEASVLDINDMQWLKNNTSAEIFKVTVTVDRL